MSEVFIFSEKIIDAIRKEYPGFANDLGNKIVREEAYAMIFFLGRNAQLDAVEKDISVFNKESDSFKLKKVIQIMQKRNQLHEQFRREFVDNFYPLKIGILYDAPLGIRNCSDFFHKFFCLKKLDLAKYEVEALFSEKTSSIVFP